MSVLPATFGRAPFSRQLAASAAMTPLVDALIRAHWAYEGWDEPEITDVLRRAYMRTAETAVGMMSVRHETALKAAERYALDQFNHVADDEDAIRQFGYEIADAYLQTVRPL